MLAEASAAPGTPLAGALRDRRRLCHRRTVSISCCSGALREQEWLAAAVRLDDDDDTFLEAEQIYRKAIGLGPDARTADIDDAARGAVDRYGAAAAAAPSWPSGSANDVKAAERIGGICWRSGPAGRVEALRGVFLTAGGEPRKALLTQGAGRRRIPARMRG